MFDFENIKKVELITEDAGVKVPTQFKLYDKEGNEALVPDDINNVHYALVREWYNRHKKPGFEFKFKDDPQPGDSDAEQSAAAPVPETDDQGAESATLAVSATQTKATKLPALNLTKDQRKEIDAENKARQG